MPAHIAGAETPITVQNLTKIIMGTADETRRIVYCACYRTGEKQPVIGIAGPSEDAESRANFLGWLPTSNTVVIEYEGGGEERFTLTDGGQTP